MSYKNLLKASTLLPFACALSIQSASADALTDLADQGFKLGGSYEAGYQMAPIGSDEGSSAKQRLTINLGVDTEKAFGLKNGQFFFQYQNHNGEHGGSNVFDIQQFDGLDDPEYNRIHMLWYQHEFMDGKLRLKVGKVEPKSEFFAPENARNHLGFSTERSPTIIAQGPPSMSINAFIKPNDNFEIAFGIYDASWNQGRDENTFKLHNFFDTSDYAMFLEGRFTWDNGPNGLPGGLKVGAWRLDGNKTKFNGDVVDGTNGFYVTYDQTLTQTGIGVYAQYGYADEEVSPLGRHVGAGFQWKGAIESRENDVFGAGFSNVKFSDVEGSPFIKGSETAYEIFYKATVTEYFLVQADLQYIVNPGGGLAEDVLVPTFRATLRF